jgi:DNA-directed RNA polymerase subunit K/omega
MKPGRRLKNNETFRHVPGVFRLKERRKVMDNKTKKVPTNTITRDVKELAAPTGNIYESVVILYKRANQIALAEKKELNKKLEDFKNERDTMEEVFENKEQIEISKYYERQPKPDLVAISEFENGELFYRRAKQED